VRIVIPAALRDELDARRLRWILARELAHVRRRDHRVPWLEWLACVCFWRNPVAWRARRNLRINEETCCDALVRSSLHPQRRSYANSLMAVVEFLVSPVIRPPALSVVPAKKRAEESGTDLPRGGLFWCGPEAGLSEW